MSPRPGTPKCKRLKEQGKSSAGSANRKHLNHAAVRIQKKTPSNVCCHCRPVVVLLPVLLSPLSGGAQTEMKKVVGDNATLPCHHQFQSSGSIDIEWLLQKPNSKQKVIITFFGGHVYTNEGTDASRLSFAGEYLGGDVSLLISDLLLTDSGEYYCKVKTGGKYHWSQVNLIVLVKPSKPICRMDGDLLEGSDVKLSCKSSDGSDPINYKWERVLDKGKSIGKLPNLALIDLKNPELMTLRNLTMDSTGVYRCTASNDVGEENCTIEVPMQRVKDMGKMAGAVVGISLGVLIVILTVWLVFRTKEKKKYEEEETPNEIREDAEAPKAKLVKPNSLSSSRSGSSRSGASSTQSMVHNSAQRGHRPRPPAVAALKENGQPPGFPQSPPAYNTVVPAKNTEPPTTPKFNSRNMSGPTPPTLMVPAQTKAFQTV
ncbi:CXADR-like membrane protein isoform X1 [Syngnathoides biaculeatus]|uniref:CXADR-like membrane protein isoform X1 n=2 Tax=Syngnathoides biaculeatus TaxID=300417 RepID=UPI002ADDE454|nr:CXADR-like membrane protein isoform X1 [Syngnathoides biaculeatus]